MTRKELLDAIAHGDVSRVAAMLHPDTPLNPVNRVLNPVQGTTPLYQAAVDGAHEIVRLLLEYGADPDQVSGGECEGLPLCAAASWDHAETVQALLDGGADPDAREGGEWTALLWAASNGNLASADILLDSGAGPDLANDDGDTPLTLAARFGAYGLVWSLLEHGADPALPGFGGATALETATRWAAVDLETAIREEVTAQTTGDHTVITARTHASDGTQRVTVEARNLDGGGYGITRQYGHAAIATSLEVAMGIRPSAQELLRRALPYRALDEDDETWWAAVHALQRRHDDETFEAAARLCDSDDPLEREFGVDVLADFGYDADRRPYRERSLPLLQDMSAQEGDPAVVESVLHALGHHADQRAVAEVLEIVNRPGRTPTVNDPMALAAVLPPDHDEGLATLIRLSESPDADVRDWATMGLAGLAADTPLIRDALAERLADSDLTTVAEAAQGLAARGDRRAIDGVHRVLCESGPDQDYARDLALEAARELGLEISGA
ncbi:ankyrin repeat domain-containing protein [Planotetraspora sp. A-T 1434]|uniref:ankyrin repeat domain-containing protein n=1 Tax=Planotetraspora sp. A-T 1434 TaxID=2979219 RepID=UPI0021C22C87|nr:ankyrin repeat domain-containing protein [Planotetraspora sp. A-T 1434]MCT9929453.1 ankyrin repeat domain-containing protein [Planotetraspora sp. A-T 1434]